MVSIIEAAKTPPVEEKARSLEQIRTLENLFRKAPTDNINTIPKLISAIYPVNNLTQKAIHAARRCLVLAQASDFSSVERTEWLSLQTDHYATALVSVIKANQDNEAMNVAVAGAALTQHHVWRKVCQAVIVGENKDLHELLFTNFVPRFADLRLGALQLVEKHVGTIETRLRALSACRNGDEDVAKTQVSKKELKSAFVKAWLAVLRVEMNLEIQQTLLRRIPNELIPVMPQPLVLSDFIISSFAAKDISTSIAALEGLFILISKHRLEYPLFYQEVYSLLRVDVFRYVEDPTRFMELVATLLLKGTMIPGNMVAAFVKRLVRRALNWPSYHAVWCLRLALDVLQKHPSTCFLVHRPVNLFDTVPNQNGEDPFDDTEHDPQASRANESSLWEVEVLKRHINPAVSRLAMAFERDLRNRRASLPGELSDYTGLQFSDIFQAEVHRKAKVSPLAYSTPGTDPSVTRLKKRLKTCVSWS
eukprot:gb/GEZJ01001867.1/.p1 GENE.gb/GEZJ01001867.1/~~gb/GEZJ01001867.1/.p1  ORF type:complete len:477 (-),score=63.72 gb/GEZJ01001867.1/:669-2099(-)